jgi:hypothetical protein
VVRLSWERIRKFGTSEIWKFGNHSREHRNLGIQNSKIRKKNQKIKPSHVIREGGFVTTDEGARGKAVLGENQESETRNFGISEITVGNFGKKDMKIRKIGK